MRSMFIEIFLYVYTILLLTYLVAKLCPYTEYSLGLVNGLSIIANGNGMEFGLPMKLHMHQYGN